MNKLFLALAVMAFGIPGVSQAQGRHAVSIFPIPYACVSLNVAPSTMYQHPEFSVPLYAAPSSSAKVVGEAIDVMVVPRWPQQPNNGFYRVVRTLNADAWIEAKYLRAWSNPFVPSARCEPAIMSDGSVGTR